jgi:hypothetical protein
LAATYTIDGSADMGGCRMLYGTWATSGGTTTGTITFSGTVGGAQGPAQKVIDATFISSVSSVTMAAAKLTSSNTLVYTCVANDSGYWSVTVA